MKSEILDNIVHKIILPKYPWIEEFKWHKNYSSDSGKNYWTLELWQTPDLDVTDEQMNKLRIEVMKDMASLFKMLGLPKTEEFFTVGVR